MEFEQSFMNFLLRHQEKHKRTYHFIILMDAITSAAKHIEHYYLTGALKGNLGQAGKVNIQGEKVMRMDDIANEVIIHHLRTTERVISLVSEESPGIIPLNMDEGRYFVYFDPIDGSSNVAHALPVGFLFGIAKRNLGGAEDFHLRAGQEYIAAGMFVIPSGTFTLALRDAGTWRFHIDETMDYVKPVRLVLPDTPKTWELSFNATNRYTYRSEVQEWLEKNQQKYKFRYIGTLSADFHRILTNGGMFMYPAILNHPDPEKVKPEGKLRLMYEASVVAFMCREAGGQAVNEDGDPILDIRPGDHHQRTPLYVGSKPLVEDIARILRRH